MKFQLYVVNVHLIREAKRSEKKEQQFLHGTLSTRFVQNKIEEFGLLYL